LSALSPTPKPGILFYDITTLLKDKKGFAELIDALAAHYIGKEIDSSSALKLVLHLRPRARLSPQCRLCARTQAPQAARSCRRVTYDLEYGSDALEIHQTPSSLDRKSSWSMICSRLGERWKRP